MTDEARDEPRTISPFKIIQRGEDTVDGDENLIFSDFRPHVMGADVVIEDDLPAPKGVSVPEPAPSSGSDQTTVQTMSENPVQALADEADGVPSPSVDLKQTSSSPKKTGSGEQVAEAKPPTSAKTQTPKTPGSQDPDIL